MTATTQGRAITGAISMWCRHKEQEGDLCWCLPSKTRAVCVKLMVALQQRESDLMRGEQAKPELRRRATRKHDACASASGGAQN